ncbi:hypothetical protein L873DRAFT_265408 [Choiromyces venosus 120613-1]|uniref:F-box domain-containing protein n=1 Tax=Choiromyces venosus 120613-1 TaxID=1336337 RepID=A0A3N4J400_9PEZI|nr:hypothetical protein L873DRAFT_265408 [Choiromyces venosus 120613-1]
MHRAKRGAARKFNFRARRSPLPFLPVEILLQIFEYLAPNNTLPQSPVHTCHGVTLESFSSSSNYTCTICQTGYLLSVNLVSRHWYKTARPLLYRVVRIGYSMFIPGDEDIYFNCRNKEFHGRDRFFFNVFDRERPEYSKIGGCNAGLIKIHEKTKIETLDARLKTLQLFQRTVTQSPDIRKMVACLELGALFPTPESGWRGQEAWLAKGQEYRYSLTEKLEKIGELVDKTISSLTSLRWIDFHLDPEVVGASAEALSYIVKKSITRMTWTSRLEGCKCNHVRIQLPTDRTEYNHLPIRSYGLSEKTPSIQLYSDYDLPHYSPAVFKALSTETCEIEINRPTLPSLKRSSPPVESVGFPMTTAMRFIGAGAPTISQVIRREARRATPGGGLLTAITVGDKDIRFADLRNLLALSKNLKHLRLENVHVSAPTREDIDTSSEATVLKSTTLKSVFWDIIIGDEEDRRTETVTYYLVKSCSEDCLPNLVSISGPVEKVYTEWWLDELKRIHPQKDIEMRSLGNDVDIMLRSSTKAADEVS